MGTIFLYLCFMKTCLTMTEGVEICGKLFRIYQRLQLWWLKKFYLLHTSVHLQTTYSNIQVLTTLNLKNNRSIVHLLPYSALHIAIINLCELNIPKLAENEPTSFFYSLLFFCYIINCHCVILLKQSHK